VKPKGKDIGVDSRSFAIFHDFLCSPTRRIRYALQKPFGREESDRERIGANVSEPLSIPARAVLSRRRPPAAADINRAAVEQRMRDLMR
jgi:hypothetical protein